MLGTAMSASAFPKARSLLSKDGRVGSFDQRATSCGDFVGDQLPAPLQAHLPPRRPRDELVSGQVALEVHGSAHGRHIDGGNARRGATLHPQPLLQRPNIRRLHQHVHRSPPMWTTCTSPPVGSAFLGGSKPNLSAGGGFSL